MARSGDDRFGHRPWTESLVAAAWFGLVSGLVEGVGLEVFQRINWARWGSLIHVSSEVIWISAVVNTAFFLIFALLIGLGARVLKRSALPLTVFCLSAFSAFHWLALTERLYRWSCVLLAIGTAISVMRWFKRHETTALNLWRRTLPWAAAITITAACGTYGLHWLSEERGMAALPAAANGAPNVLFIVVDTLRADHLSSQGYAAPITPNIDRLGREGVQFENAFSTCSWTMPSHVSLMTGLYVFEHGFGAVGPMPVMAWGGESLGGIRTLGEAMEGNGYRTGVFSANRVYFDRDLGFARGVMHFEDYFHSPADMFSRTMFGREMARPLFYRSEKSKVTRAIRAMGLGALLDQDAEGPGDEGGSFTIRKRAEDVNAETLRWIERKPDRPFFAFLNYFDVHNPYGGPDYRSERGRDSVTEQYDAGLKYVDEKIGQLLAALEERGLSRNTIVVITADHGEGLGDHHLSGHGAALFRELIHVPLIVWNPSRIPSGVRIATPVTNAALPATIMDLVGGAGLQFPRQSLAQLWKNSDSQQNWPYPIAELLQNRYANRSDQAAEREVATAADGPIKTIISPQWQLILHKKFGVQLYRWAQDPGEAVDRAQSSEGLGVAGQLIPVLQATLEHKDAQPMAGRLKSARPMETATYNEAAGVSDGLFRVAAKPGSRFTISVHGLEGSGGFDPGVMVYDANASPMQTCRNTADDNLPAPGVSDATPTAFDDLCVNDDAVPGGGNDAKLQVEIPEGTPGAGFVYVRVSGWDGRREAHGPKYSITVSDVTNSSNATASASALQ